MSNKPRAVEIAVQDLEGVRIALAEGAQRIELCVALGLGGLTPSIGLVEAAVGAADEAGVRGFVHVLIRPRGGGFVYTPDEVAVIVADIRAVAGAGADGVVVGALRDGGEVELETTRALVDAAGALETTFHRAVDAAADPLAALDALAGLGVRRILSSGQAARSIDGVATLAALATHSAGRVQIMAGGGVGVPDIPALIAAGVDAVHLSARRTATGAPSGPGGGDTAYDATDASLVRAAIVAARTA